MSAVQPAPQSAEERTWGMLCHLAALAGFMGLFLGNIVGPLVVWLIKKDQYPFVNDQGKESLNFQISMILWAIASLVVVGVGVFVTLLLIAPSVAPLAMPLIWLLAFGFAILDLVLVIVASIAASNGKSYRYPLTIRFIK